MENQDRIVGRHSPTARRRTGPVLFVIVGSMLASTLGGCVYSHEKERVVSAPAPVVTAPAPVVVAPSTERVVTYSEGRWQLYGDGTASGPYFWAWIPAGTTPPPPPPLPRMSSGR
jgi:hypothetical protein